MAVTYAWRLDSDKYAYILPPYPLDGNSTSISGTYGFLSKSPLNGYALRNVAEAAEEQFGKSNENGLSNYTEAFMIMESKIDLASTDEYVQKFTDGDEEIFSGWTNMQYADLLSADVYYDVDSTNCADLRGVGIKGTRYLGSITGQTYADGTLTTTAIGGVNIENMAYISSGSEITFTSAFTVNGIASSITATTIVQPGMAGFTDVYGIYLTDNLVDDNGDVTVPLNTPEYMFVIRNGMNGPQGPQGEAFSIEDTAVTATLVTKSELSTVTSVVSEHSELIDTMEDNIIRLTNYYNTISLNNINSLMVKTSRLEQQMATMKEYLFGLNVTMEAMYDDINGGSEGGGTTLTAIPLGKVKDSLREEVVLDDYDNTSDTVDYGKISDEWDGEMDKIKSKKFHLLGYLENDTNYLTDEDGYRKPVTLDKLYILPNIGVSLTGITFGIEERMHVNINGDATSRAISTENVSVENKVCAKTGFYQQEYDGNIAKVDDVKPDDFKEPNLE